MALYRHLTANTKIGRILCTAFILTRHNSNVDVLDVFTTELLDRKSRKWEQLKKCSKAPLTRVEINFANIRVEELDAKFNCLLDDCNSDQIVVFVKECLKWQVFPSKATMSNIFETLAQNGDVDLLEKLGVVYENCEHYVAEAKLNKGQINEGLEIIEFVYTKNPYLRRKLVAIVYTAMYKLSSKYSEAVLINVKEFALKMLKQHKDERFAVCVWRNCILSDWFSDQQMAVELFETNEELRDAILQQIPLIVNIALRNHKTSNVYQLFEMLLKHEKAYVSYLPYIMLPLFNYHLKQGDLRRCFSIIEWSRKNNVQLPTVVRNNVDRVVKYNLKF